VPKTVTASTLVLAAIRERVAALHAAVDPDTDPVPTLEYSAVGTPETGSEDASDEDGGTSVTVPAADDETPDDYLPRASEPDGLDVERLADALADLDAVVSGFASLIEGSQIGALRAELAWARSTVEETRALDGTVDVLEELVEDLDPTLRQGPVEARVGIVVASRTAERNDAVNSMLAQPEWTSLLAHADQLVLTAPIAGGKPKHATKVLARALADADAAAREAADAAVAEAQGSDRAAEPALGAVAAAASTVATTARVTRGVLGKQARKLADAADALAGSLDERRRSEAVAHWLVDLADLAHRAGEPSFTYGVLHAEARARRTAADEALAAAVTAYTKPKLHKWLKDLA
jgi:hypothetical protein